MVICGYKCVTSGYKCVISILQVLYKCVIRVLLQSCLTAGCPISSSTEEFRRQ